MNIVPERGQVNSLLARHLGSEAAAEEERRRICRRQKEDGLRCRALAERDSPDKSRRTNDPLFIAAELRETIRAEVACIRDGVLEMIRAEVQRILMDQLPEAVQYLVREQWRRNGQATCR